MPGYSTEALNRMDINTGIIRFITALTSQLIMVADTIGNRNDTVPTDSPQSYS